MRIFLMMFKNKDELTPNNAIKINHIPTETNDVKVGINNIKLSDEYLASNKLKRFRSKPYHTHRSDQKKLPKLEGYNFDYSNGRPQTESNEIEHLLGNDNPKIEDEAISEFKFDADPEEEEDEEEKFENVVEAKDFQYFKQQCKFEKFVNQLNNKNNFTKEQSALYSMFGSSVQQVYQNNEPEEEITEPVVGFDTRFTYTREGLMVYDINAEIIMDGPNDENKGIDIQDYNVFKNTTPANEIDKNTRYDYYQKFKSYRNALAPFAGLEFATEHERKIYEYLPPFKKRKVHDKTWKMRIPNTQNIIFFNSDFESGNLHRATRISDYEYNLYLEYDKNSRNYTQWFYFSCRNVKKGVSVTFNIINLLKIDSLYNEGMKP